MVSGYAASNLRPNPRFARTSDTRQPLCAIIFLYFGSITLGAINNNENQNFFILYKRVTKMTQSIENKSLHIKFFVLVIISTWARQGDVSFVLFK